MATTKRIGEVELSTLSPTDRSLLAAQEYLGNIRHIDEKLVVVARKKARMEMVKRVVTSANQPKCGFDLQITFVLRGIKTGDGVYDAVATISYLSGIVAERKRDVVGARKAFREVIVKELGSLKTKMFKDFWTKTQLVAQKGEGTADGREQAKDAFRRWIVEKLQDKKSPVYNAFDERVQISRLKS